MEAVIIPKGVADGGIGGVTNPALFITEGLTPRKFHFYVFVKSQI